MQSGNELHERGFSRSRGSNNRDRLAFRYHQRDIPQCRGAVIGEVQVSKLDRSLNLKLRQDVRTIAYLGNRVEDIVQPLHRGAASLQ